MQNKKHALKTTLEICPFARRSEGLYFYFQNASNCISNGFAIKKKCQLEFAVSYTNCSFAIENSITRGFFKVDFLRNQIFKT